jgi:hypothetical protein
MVDQLEEADAPFRIYRWIGYGKTLPDRVVRLALALRFRRQLEPGRLGRSRPGSTTTWLQDAETSVAEKLFYASPSGATLREWISKNMFRLTGSNGSMDPKFWLEINQRLQLIDVLTFLKQVDQKLLLKPKRMVRTHDGRPRRTTKNLTSKELQLVRHVLEKVLVENGEIEDPDNGDT